MPVGAYRFFEPVQHQLASSYFVICYQLLDHRADSKHIKGLVKAVSQSNPALGSAMEARMVAIDAVRRLRRFAQRYLPTARKPKPPPKFLRTRNYMLVK